ncbi:MAG TPA: hypothetical protein VNI01_01085 [Elusimicrobiota bacterium]|jgi:hypothetical protein|nr:hypothetical protein [Elusimicrobiota bacterium]
MTRTEVRRHAAALVGFIALALLYTLPVARRFATHFPGTPGETFNNVWNMWHFRWTLTHPGGNPLWTDHLYWPYGSNLLLVHGTLVHSALAFVLQPLIGAVRSYNAVYLLSLVLAGYGVYGLLRDWGHEPGIAFVSGAAFAFSPIMTQQNVIGRGWDYVSFHPVPFFLWALVRCMRDKKVRDAALAGLALAWCWLCNYYYFLGCMLWLPAAYLLRERPLTLEASPRRPGAAARTAGFVLLGVTGAALLAALARGQVEFHGAGSMRELLRYVAPYLFFWAAVAANLALRWRPRARLDLSALRWERWSPYAGTLACWAAAAWPMIAATVWSMASGDYGAPHNRWRGGGNPMDLAVVLQPAAFQPLWRPLMYRWFEPTFYVSFGLTPLLPVLFSWRRLAQDPWASLWLKGFLLFFSLMLGPWLKLFGVHTYLPLPFYFLHALPVFINMTIGYTFNVVASCLLCLAFASALREVKAAASPAWRPRVAAAAACLLAFEFCHGGLRTFRLDFPGLIYRLADRPDGVVLPIPAGANFHVIVNPGPIGEAFMEQELAQTIHHKPIMGGHLGRVARRVYDRTMGDPVFQGLIRAQEGAPPEPILTDRARIARYLADMRVRYVLVETARARPALQAALASWPMRAIDEEGTLRLFETAAIRR